jgi:hypothetical protein
MINPLNAIYYLTGMWADFPKDRDPEGDKRKIVESLLSTEEEADCSDVEGLGLYNNDRILLTKDGETVDYQGHYKKEFNQKLIKKITDEEKQKEKERLQKELDEQEEF